MVQNSDFLKFIKVRLFAFMSRFAKYDAETKAALIVLICSLVNIFLSAVSAVAGGIYLLVRERSRRDIFAVGTNKLTFAFIAYCAVVSAINVNIIGVAASVFFFFCVVIMLFCRRNMSRRLLEDMINIYIGYSVIAFFIAVVEKIIGLSFDEKYRCSSTFINPLYYSFFVSIAVLMCTYRIITVKKYRRLYLPILIINAVAMLLSGSRMPWIGMFVGLVVLLLACRKYKLVGIFGAFIMLLMLIAVAFPDLDILRAMRLNSIDDAYSGRQVYWDYAMKGFLDKPLFGHGMLGVLNDTMKSDADWASRFFTDANISKVFANMKLHDWKLHAHNIAFDGLYNFGIIGSLMFCLVMFKRCFSMYRDCGFSSNNPAFALLVGVIISIGVNGVVDCEVIGFQTAVFTVLLFSVTGLYEKRRESMEYYKFEPQR